MNPSIWIYGGIHDDPGSRQRFIEEFTKQGTAPHLVAVEWEQSVFTRFAEQRPLIEEGLRFCGDFLTPEDCYELSLALAWEGDSYVERFPGTDVLWLESEFQEVDLKRRYGMDASKVPESWAKGLRDRLWRACRPPSEPRSKKELIDRAWRTAWAEVYRESGGLERDARWANAICESSVGLGDGWIAVVVGWAHADPEDEDQRLRLRGLLLSQGYSVNSVCLGP